MLNWVTNYFKSELDLASENFKIWEEWQKNQLPSHYIDSQLHTYIPPKKGYRNMYIKYCFGLFEQLIYLPENSEPINYFKLLITFYDKCKGYVRTFKGDPEGISLIRSIIKNEKLDELYNHNFNIYAYNYTAIHAHTVAYFSLSTLILFFISNYMHHKSYNSDIFPFINQDLCKTPYNNKIYGDISYVKTRPTSSIIIKDKTETSNIRPCNSWPSIVNNVNTPLKCVNCQRTSENYWGKHKLCLDCHLYKVCLICGGDYFCIASDNYPRCLLHQNMHNI